jgi:hypothetical protein
VAVVPQALAWQVAAVPLLTPSPSAPQPSAQVHAPHAAQVAGPQVVPVVVRVHARVSGVGAEVQKRLVQVHAVTVRVSVPVSPQVLANPPQPLQAVAVSAGQSVRVVQLPQACAASTQRPGQGSPAETQAPARQASTPLQKTPSPSQVEPSGAGACAQPVIVHVSMVQGF